MRQFTIILFLSIMLFGNRLIAQKLTKPPIIVCPAGEHSDFRLGPPEGFRKLLSNGRSLSSQKTANIVVTYNGFGDRNVAARDAFQYAVDIWSTLIKSDVTIYLSATYEELDNGVLGSAGTTAIFRGFEGAPNDTTFYNVALAEKLYGSDLNTPGEADISASFNSDFDWYLGTDGETPDGLYDFVTVVLHEIGHGLGFFAIDSYDEDTDIGSRNSGVYDNYIVNGAGVSIYDIPNESAELGEFLTSEDLFLNSPLAFSSNGDSNPRIFAPSPYDGGSSISHWDESTFNSTVDALMTPQVGSGESMHDPGPNTLSLFAEFGWVNTKLEHEASLIVGDYSSPLDVSIQISSDTTLAEVSPMVHYSYDGFATVTDELMTSQADDIYNFSIPNPGEDAIVEYYISGVTDDLGRAYFSPSNSSSRHRAIVKDFSITSLPFTLDQGGDFETEGAFVQVPYKGNTYLWERGVPSNVLDAPSSGTQVWKTDLDAGIDIPDANYSAALISPKYDFSDPLADYILSFDLSMDVGAGAGLSAIYTVDGGSTWLSVGAPSDGRGTNWMNRSGEFDYIETGNVWVLDNSGDAPTTVSYNLSEIVGENGQEEVYFALVASISNIYREDLYGFDGIMIDDFQITKTEPRASFTLAGSSVNFPEDDIQFTFISNGAETYSWDFGDGSTSSAKDPVHAYSEGGVYDVTLTITYDGGSHANTVESAVTIVSTEGSSYSLVDGGDMESNNADFLVENISGTPLELGQSTIEGKEGTASGDFAWVSGIEEEEYANSSVAYLYTPIFDFSILGSYELTFKANYSFEQGWDGFIIEYTDDLGETWSQLNPEVAEDWYDMIGEDNPDQGWPAIPLFTGTTSGDFVSKSTDVSGLSGNEGVGFRVHFRSDALEVDAGMAFDDFELTGPELGTPVPSFEFEVSDGCAVEVVEFVNLSTGSIVSAEWDFGTGASPSTASGTGPHLVTFSEEGEYNIVLTAADADGTEYVYSEVLMIGESHTPTVSVNSSFTGEGQELVASSGDSYQWYANGELIEGATESNLVVTESRLYKVEVTINGCVGVSDEITAGVLSSATFDKSNYILAYPNPTSNSLTIERRGFGLDYTRVSLINVLGQVQYQADLSGAKDEILDVSNLSHGTYVLRVNSGENIFSTRVVIIR